MKAIRRGLVALMALGALMPSWAQNYPSKPITLVVPAPAGSAPDVIARMFAEHARARLGQSVVVENKVGAGGIVGVNAVKDAPADGHRLFFAQAAVVVVTPFTFKEAKYDMARDFEAISVLASTPMMVVANVSNGPKTWQEAITRAKAKAEDVSIGNPGRTTIPHLTAELVDARTSGRMQQVAFGATAQGIQAVVNGDVNMYIDGVAPLLPLTKAGRMRALAVFADRELPGLEGIPLAKSVVPGIAASGWFGLFAPKGTPQSVLEKLNATASAAAADPEIVAKMRALGNYPVAGSLQETREFIDKERTVWADVIKRANIQAE